MKIHALIISLVSVVVVGCGGSSTPEATNAPTAREQPAPKTNDEVGTDLSKIKAMEMLTKEEVVKLTGGAKLAQEPNDFSSENHPSVRYLVEFAGGSVDSFQFGLSPANELKMMLDLEKPDEKGEAVSGPWTEGWYGKNDLGEGNQLRVLQGDKFALTVRCSADKKEAILALGKELVNRVK